MNTICEAEEFKDVRWKSHERDVFRDLNKDCFIAYPIKENVSTTAHKASLLVQVALGSVNLANVPEYIRRQMAGETKAVLETMHRLVRAVVECKASDSDGTTCRVALELERSMTAKAWEGRSIQLTQVPQVGPVLMRKFVAAGITTISSLAGAATGDIERIASRNPPFGKKLLDELEAFPRLTLEAHIVGDKTRGPSDMPVANVDAVLGFSNAKGKPKWRGKIPSVTFMAETTEGELAYWWRGSLRKFRAEDGNKVSLRFEVELHNCKEDIICHFSCDEIVGTAVSQILQHHLPASAFPQKPCRQSPVDYRKATAEISTTASWLDDEIDDGDMLEVIQSENAKNQDQCYSDALEDEDLWPVIDRDGNIECKEDAAQKMVTKTQKQLKSPYDDTTEETLWEPIKLPNGKYKCNHSCADAGLKKNGRACTHKCCRDGVENPRKPRKMSSKRKAEDDRTISDVARAPEKRVNGGEHSEPKAKPSQNTSSESLSTYSYRPSNVLMDLDCFDVDDEGLIDLTRADGASEGCSMNRKESVPTCNQANAQSAYTDEFSGSSVFECLVTEEHDEPAETTRLQGATVSPSSKKMYPCDLSASSQLYVKKAVPTPPGCDDFEDLLDSPALTSSNYSPSVHGDHPKRAETEEEALASMSDIFSADFAYVSKWDPVNHEHNVDLPFSQTVDQTPKDSETTALQTPQNGGAAAEVPTRGHDGSKVPTQKKFEWMTEADRDFIDEYLDLVEIID